MGLWDKLRGEFIDIIEWTEPSGSELLAYRFPRYNNEIKMGAKLTVRNSAISGNAAGVGAAATAGKGGGGIYLGNGGTLLVEDSTISGNSAVGRTD